MGQIFRKTSLVLSGIEALFLSLLQCFRQLPSAPILRFPVESLQEIFRETVASLPHGKEATRGILALGRVCHFWREIVFSDPRLWERISVAPGQVHLSRIFLFLSKARPLTLHIDTTCDSDFSANELERMKQLLGPHANRVVDLTINIRHSNKCVQKNYETPFRQLGTSSFHDEDDPTLPHRAFEDSPFDTIFSRPLNKLTSLSLVADESLLVGGVITLLQNCPALEVVNLEKTHNLSHRTFSADLASNAKINLPKLRELFIVDYGHPFVSVLLKGLEIPDSTAVYIRFATSPFGFHTMHTRAVEPAMARIERATIHFGDESAESSGAATKISLSLSSENTAFDMQWQWYIASDESPNTIHINPQPFRLRSLVHLRIYAKNVDVKRSTWKLFLDGLPSLKTLDIFFEPLRAQEPGLAVGHPGEAALAVLRERGRPFGQDEEAEWVGRVDSEDHVEHYICEFSDHRDEQRLERKDGADSE